MTKIKILTAVAAIALMTASSAYAKQLEVKGNSVVVGVVGQNATNLALGKRAKAEQNIGSFSGDRSTKIGGNSTVIGVVGKNATNLALGKRAKACQDIGSFGNRC